MHFVSTLDKIICKCIVHLSNTINQIPCVLHNIPNGSNTKSDYIPVKYDYGVVFWQRFIKIIVFIELGGFKTELQIFW